VIGKMKMFTEIYNIKRLFINPNLLIMKSLELNPEFNLLGQIDLNSVKIALDRDEMEEIVGGYGGGGARAVDWACVGVGIAGVASGIFTFGAGAMVAVTLGGAFCTGWGAGRLIF
jgi:hypothetical protein